LSGACGGVRQRFAPERRDNNAQSEESRTASPNGFRLSGCGLRAQVRHICPGPRCMTAHNRSLRRRISLSSTGRDRRLAQLVSIEAHRCIGCSASRAVAAPACASDSLIVGHSVKRMATTLRKRPTAGPSPNYETGGLSIQAVSILVRAGRSGASALRSRTAWGRQVRQLS
jgi:hypothetical protein